MISSYQKLKKKIEEQDEKFWSLREFIAKATDDELELFKKIWHTENSIINMWWRGDTQIKDTSYNGILTLMKDYE
jgi:hypothetical protein